MVQSLSMCLRPATPRILTEPMSFGVIDPSKRVSRAELDRCDKLWREKQQRNGTTIQVVKSRASFESDMTRVEGRQHYQSVGTSTSTSTSNMANQRITSRGVNVKLWRFPRRQQVQAAGS